VITTIADRPDLLGAIVPWLHEAFWGPEHSLAETEAAFAKSTSRRGPQQTWVLLEQTIPVATASLVHDDLPERPHLTPWLAALYVVPAARRRGHATRLVSTVIEAARDAMIPTLWLYTNTAEALYAKLGWEKVEVVPRRNNTPVALMRYAAGSTD